MDIYSLRVGPIQANCYLVVEQGRGFIIDPGGDSDKIIAACEKAGLTPAAILLTHGHFDHVGGIDGLLRKWPELPIYFHPGDRGSGQLAWEPTPTTQFISDNQELSIAGIQLQVYHTPGHSPGSVVYRCGENLFTGDTLFAGSMGRTDFPGGSYMAMMSSLKRLGELEGDFQVFPGHEGSSTLNQERQTNPYLREAMGGGK